MEKVKNTHGGKRAGAGKKRLPVHRSPAKFYADELEKELLKGFLAFLRNQDADIKNIKLGDYVKNESEKILEKLKIEIQLEK